MLTIMPLTRFLYMGDEVLCTFLECLLKRKDLRQCYFWICEYYYSGFYKKTWQFLWQVFYDFYSIKHPKIEGLLRTQFLKWSGQKKIKFVMNIVSTLFNLQPNCEVFVVRQIAPIKKSYRGREPSWVSIFPKEYRGFIRSVAALCYPDILYHCREKPPDILYTIIIKYFTEIKKMNLHSSNLSRVPYGNKSHIMLALIIHLKLLEAGICLKDELSYATAEDIRWIKKINNEMVSPVYRTLPKKCVYTVSNTIGCFALNRFREGYPPMKKLLGHHWEYFASFSPLWRKRFSSIATRDRVNFQMIFKDDDVLEEFGEKYNYEPDEQNNEIQDKNY